MPDLAEFKAFYQSFMAAARAGDDSALRATLPADIPDDHFAFLSQMNKSFADDAAEPTYSCEDNFATVTYTQEDENGSETMTREFWWHDGKWVSYNPEEIA